MLQFPLNQLPVLVKTSGGEIDKNRGFARLIVHFFNLQVPLFIRMPETASEKDWRPIIEASSVEQHLSLRHAELVTKNDGFALTKLEIDGTWHKVYETLADKDN